MGCFVKSIAKFHPSKICIPVDVALRDWNRAGGIVQQKMDGQFSTREIDGVLYAGELMRGGQFYAFDVLAIRGESVAHWPLDARWQRLCAKVESLRLAGVLLVPNVHSERGAVFLAEVLAAGGEGCVLKDWGATYGTPMIAAKRGGIWTCRVTGHCGGTQSVFIVDAETGEDRGKVTLRGGKCDQVRAGSIIRVEGMNLTDSGKIRQPVSAREFLVKY